ncbi:MAG: peptidylprolyl isomerase [Caldilineaceae bacterium]|nr:peptidylprolyl isomerase [Caldilineaceae bacterium]HRJ42951.1 peptidylprolyl isomerase [Caldilineaceae bacterium]
MAKRRKNQQEAPKAETPKEVRLRARDWERNKQILTYVVPAVALALLLVLGGAVNELLIKPGSVLAKVEEKTIVTRDFWKRARLQETQLQEQLFQYQLFSQQFGGQDFFASQISQLQATLASPISLGTQVINAMIDEEVINLAAAEMGVSVSEAEIDDALREEIAARQGALTVPQATATAEAGVEATATAASLPPTPTATAQPTVAASEGVTETTPAEPIPTVEAPTPEPPTILDDTLYNEGLTARSDQLKKAGMSVADYREVLRAQLLREKMQDAIGDERVTATEEQVHARHILIRIDPPAVDETSSLDSSGELTGTVESAPEATASAALTDTVALEDDAIMSEAEALALATQIRQRILDGEDFAALAAEYSDDPGSGANGGDLGWARRGAYVPEFDETVFTLPIGDTSELVKTQFGYHIIQVIERDENRAKDENTLAQEKSQAFQTWLQERILATKIERPENLLSKLPAGLGQ